MVKLIHFIAGMLFLVVAAFFIVFALSTGTWQQFTAAAIAVGITGALMLCLKLYVEYDRRAIFEKVCKDMKAKYGYSDEVDAEIRALAKRKP